MIPIFPRTGFGSKYLSDDLLFVVKVDLNDKVEEWRRRKVVVVFHLVKDSHGSNILHAVLFSSVCLPDTNNTGVA